MHVLSLVEKPRAMLATKPDFFVYLNGQRTREIAYFNTRGYRVGLPLPCGTIFDPGEISLTQLRKEINAINRDAKAQEKKKK